MRKLLLSARFLSELLFFLGRKGGYRVGIAISVLSLHSSQRNYTGFVKHFIAETSYAQQADYAFRGMMAGYGNTTSAINAVRFKFNSANIQSGTIKMYGVS